LVLFNSNFVEIPFNYYFDPYEEQYSLQVKELGVPLDLFDSGNIALHGDLVQRDGVYSLKIQVDQNNMKGTYRFEFQARDRGKKLSNIINHFVLIQ